MHVRPSNIAAAGREGQKGNLLHSHIGLSAQSAARLDVCQVQNGEMSSLDTHANYNLDTHNICTTICLSRKVNHMKGIYH